MKPAFYFVLFISLKPYSTHIYFILNFLLQAILQNVKVSSYALPICVILVVWPLLKAKSQLHVHNIVKRWVYCMQECI